MEPFERRIEKDYQDFKTSFGLKYSNYVCAYFYSNKQTDSLYNIIIQQYHARHRKVTLSHKTVLKSLNQETKRLLNELPENLRKTVRNLKPTRANHRHNGSQAFRQLWQLSKSNSPHFDIYLSTIIKYYVISKHIVELKRYAQEAEQRLKCTSAFLPYYSHCRMLLWHNHLFSAVKKIRFKNEWYAIYYSMKHCLRPRSMHAFADMMNQWYPHCQVPCTYDAISDYNFLTTIPSEQWQATPVATKTKATPIGMQRIYTFLTTNLPDLFDPFDQHFLF